MTKPTATRYIVTLCYPDPRGTGRDAGKPYMALGPFRTWEAANHRARTLEAVFAGSDTRIVILSLTGGTSKVRP